MSRMSETPEGVLETYDWQDVAEHLQEENEKLKKEIAKLHIIQQEFGGHIENTHIIDDYQKTYFMSNKWLIELKNGKFVYIDELNDNYEDLRDRVDKALELLRKHKADLDYEPWSIYQVRGSILFDLANVLESKNGKERITKTNS